MQPLADKIRAKTIDDVVGQKHLIGDGKVLRNMIENKNCVNMIFYGPSGVGKTTVANIIAKNMDMAFYKLNATTASVKDVHEIIKDLNKIGTLNGILLYLDEIQNFNKKQQQSLLDYIERGDITLIASTTENPYFYVYGALLSRCLVFEFKKIEEAEVKEFLLKTADELKVKIEDKAAEHIARCAAGDVRRALNVIDIIFMNKTSGKKEIKLKDVEDVLQTKYLDYDKNGNNHYDYLSGFQKSIRGSDPNAAVHYLARLISAGDLPSICRRLLVIAAEDIGLAYPNAISIVKSCTDAAKEVGFPEASIILAHAVILLSILPKSNSGVNAVGAALSDIEREDIGEMPKYIRDPNTSMTKSKEKYKYPHDYPNHYVDQAYLPSGLMDAVYYEFGRNKFEDGMKKYWDEVKNIRS